MITRRQALAAWAATLGTALPATQSWAGRDAASQAGKIRLADGRWLGYQEYGVADGPPVFYFHGTPGSRLEFGLCETEGLQSGLRIISVDRPGMGLSSYHGGRRILDWSDDVVQLAAQLGYAESQFGIIGLSGGAPYAAACAYKIPHRLSHVALVSGHTPIHAPGTRPGNQDKLIELIARRPRLGELAFKLVDRRLDRRPDKVVQKLSQNWSAADKKLVLCSPAIYQKLVMNLNEASRCGPSGMVKDVSLLARSWGFRLSDIQGVPISIWQGGCDRTVTPSMGNYFQQQIAGSELIIDSRAGHVTMFKWHAAEVFARFVG